jgi:hypothetical protein
MHARSRLTARDPLAAKHSVRASFRQRQTSPSVTFDQAARAYHDSHSAAWRNPLHARQWLQTLVDHVFPTIASSPEAILLKAE